MSSSILEFLADDDYEEEGAPREAVGSWPYSINSGGPQLLPGRTRRCCFWVSVFVPYGMRYVIDTSQLAGQRWVHNPAGDRIPEDALLVVIRPDDAEHIRKAMATWRSAPHPAAVAARIIDSQCREDPTLAGRMRWKVRA